MHELISDIVSYLEYLNTDCGLHVTVHFDEATIRTIPQSIFNRLLPYNIHKNPYCALVKKSHWESCILSQGKVMQKKCDDHRFCGTCYAGVREYIYQITRADNVVGYVALSGYRAATPTAGCVDTCSWQMYLRDEELPMALCDAVLPPLGRMLELLLTYPAGDLLCDEYCLLIQYLNERHGRVTLQELCDRFGRSKSYISHMFNEKCGMTLRAYCNDLKLNRAKTLLIKNDMPVTEIAMDVGFNDSSYFIARFKEKFGISPLKYRKNFNNNI